MPRAPRRAGPHAHHRDDHRGGDRHRRPGDPNDHHAPHRGGHPGGNHRRTPAARAGRHAPHRHDHHGGNHHRTPAARAGRHAAARRIPPPGRAHRIAGHRAGIRPRGRPGPRPSGRNHRADHRSVPHRCAVAQMSCGRLPSGPRRRSAPGGGRPRGSRCGPHGHPTGRRSASRHRGGRIHHRPRGRGPGHSRQAGRRLRPVGGDRRHAASQCPCRSELARRDSPTSRSPTGCGPWRAAPAPHPGHRRPDHRRHRPSAGPPSGAHPSPSRSCAGTIRSHQARSPSATVCPCVPRRRRDRPVAGGRRNHPRYSPTKDTAV
jgi:hypothetical protein